MRTPYLLFVALSVGTIPAQSACDYPRGSNEYLVTYVDSRWEDRPFCIRVSTTNTVANALLEEVVRGIEAGRNDIVAIPIGKIKRHAPSSAHSWSFIFKPKSVAFAEQSMEVCDSNFLQVEENLDAWLRSRIAYCPWINFHAIQKGRRVWLRPKAASKNGR